MSLKDDMKLLSERKCYIVGALHILRSEQDLLFVLANCMQSTQLLIALIAKCKKKYSSTKNDLQFIAPLERVLSKLMRQFNLIFAKLAAKEEICIAGVAVVAEAVAVMQTKMVVGFLKLYEKYSSDHTVGIIGMVLCGVR